MSRYGIIMTEFLRIYVSAICEIKHEVCGQDANIAQGKADCYISIEAMC